jgi:carbonic anhydrase
MRPRFRPFRRAMAPGRAAALAAAALCALAGGAVAAPEGSILVADMAPIPTSPSFRMGMRRGQTGAPVLSHGDELTSDHDHGRGEAGGGADDATITNGAAAAPGKGAASAPAHPVAAKAAGTPRAAGAASAASAAGAEPSPADVLEHLRERLAEKLGATPAGGSSRYVMRVSNRGESGENVVSSVHAGAAAAGRRHGAGAAAGTSGAAPAAALPTDPWDYDGPSGPEAWGRMAGYEKCAGGTRQSPIDIRDGIAVDLEPIRFDYRPGTFGVVDTGRTVQVNVAPGNAITVMGRRYELVQFHFHRPAEERIDGRGFDMVVHLVHKDSAGRLAVVAVLLERGAPQAAVQSVWNNLPLEKGEELTADVPLDPADLLPADRRYYTYMGSLTTPPCSEGVLWMVMKQPVQISPEQDAIFAHLYPMNARPIQQASGRLIKSSN